MGSPDFWPHQQYFFRLGRVFFGKTLMNCKLIADCKEYKITKGFIKVNTIYWVLPKTLENQWITKVDRVPFIKKWTDSLGYPSLQGFDNPQGKHRTWRTSCFAKPSNCATVTKWLGQVWFGGSRKSYTSYANSFLASWLQFHTVDGSEILLTSWYG